MIKDMDSYLVKNVRYIYVLFFVDILWSVLIGYGMDNDSHSNHNNEIILLPLSTVIIYVFFIWAIHKSDVEKYPNTKTQLGIYIVLVVVVFSIPFFMAINIQAVAIFHLMNLLFYLASLTIATAFLFKVYSDYSKTLKVEENT